MKRAKINNIEELREKYRRASVLRGRTSKERKVILHKWRASLPESDRERLKKQMLSVMILNDGLGEESALEFVFKLVEFTHYVHKFAKVTPNKKECVSHDISDQE